MTAVRLAFFSLVNRRWTAALTIFAIALSVALLLGVDRLREDARNSFANTISGTDLIVGARTGDVQLLLYSVFRIGNATNNLSWRSYEALSQDRRIAWTIPFSLGDSHRGYRVLGTTADYFEHYRYADRRSLAFKSGESFDDVFDVVLGAEVADTLGYRLGDRIVVQHGIGSIGAARHEDKPFTVTGILAPTGTPVDRTLHVSLRGIEAMHIDFDARSRASGRRVTADDARSMELEPTSITAFLVGLRSKTKIFSFQRDVNTWRSEPLVAILPGVALQELWSVLSVAETALSAVAGFVVVTGLLGMVTMLLAGLEERRREMAILRSVGAGPGHILTLLVSEAAFLTITGAALGMAVTYAGLTLATPIIGDSYGLHVTVSAPTLRTWGLLSLVVMAGIFAGLIPAWRATRRSLADGLVVRS